MRVIKENNVERQVKCETCGSIIAYETKEINNILFPTIRCPVCSQLTKVSKFDRKVRKHER